MLKAHRARGPRKKREGSRFYQGLGAQNVGMFCHSKDESDRPHKVGFYPHEKMLCPELCFSKNMQKENTDITTIQFLVVRQIKTYIITHDQFG